VKEGKIWGNTETIESNHSFELCRAEVKVGYECSKHHHVYKWNGFFVESGVLEIHVWNQYDIVEVTTLKSGEYTKVAPNKNHKFVCKENCVLFETYWVEFKSEDIVRETLGGKCK
jgi:mannose-6-phosphate isomerase-like protein (cupin superfamily)